MNHSSSSSSSSNNNNNNNNNSEQCFMFPVSSHVTDAAAVELLCN